MSEEEQESCYCDSCDMVMSSIPGMRRAWQCPICQATCIRKTSEQLLAQSISFLDQLLAEERDDHAKKIISKAIRRTEYQIAHHEHLKSIGFVFGTIEEWEFPE